VIPPGEHEVRWSTGTARGPGLVRLTAEIGSASLTADSLSFRYDARGRAMATLDRRATAITVDGDPATLELVPGGEDRVVWLPPGNHEVTISTD
jgi:hypothetical protein